MDRKEYMRQYYLKNREKMRAQSRANYQENKEAYKKRSREWEENNPERHRELQNNWRRSEKGQQQSRDWYAENTEDHLERCKDWKSRNVAKVRKHTRTRQASLKQRTPPWLTPEDHKKIQAFYDEAHRLEQADGVKRHVDHVVPLQGETVSGLHVPENLQILTESENCRKWNRPSPVNDQSSF